MRGAKASSKVISNTKDFHLPSAFNLSHSFQMLFADIFSMAGLSTPSQSNSHCKHAFWFSFSFFFLSNAAPPGYNKWAPKITHIVGVLDISSDSSAPQDTQGHILPLQEVISTVYSSSLIFPAH